MPPTAPGWRGCVAANTLAITKRITGAARHRRSDWKRRRSCRRCDSPPARPAALLLLCGGALLGAGAAQGIEHRVVALMAGVLEVLIAGLLGKRESDLERAHIGFRIVHRHFVPHLVRSHTRVTFDERHGIAQGRAPAIRAGRGLIAE